MNDSKKERAPIRLSKADYERAYKKAKQFKKLLEKGKTKDEIFKDLLRLISVD
ncbi:MAG: hypothetical protein ACOC44_14170 [Promethearchaeia archaeon]